MTEAARLTTLESGARVVTEAMPSVRSIALGFWVRAGSRDEDQEHAGISHFLEHLLFKGTDRFSSREIDEAFDAMGAEVNAGTGKVVKTTTFGAFVELAKGTDGLIHISNIAPGQRPNTVEEVVNRGDELKVKVVEVDPERGRIGLRLADDPEIAGKSPEELAAMGTGDKGGRGDRGNGRGRREGRGGGRDRDRRPRDRDRPPRSDRDPDRERAPTSE